MRSRAVVWPGLLTSTLAAISIAPLARAADVAEWDGAPVRVDVNETSILKYHFDNRNDVDAVNVVNKVDDDYGEWLNRFNVTGAWKSWQAGVRFDTATYFHRPDAGSFSDQTAASRQLAYRYRNMYAVEGPCFGRSDDGTGGFCLYAPSKVYVTYATPDLEATVGDTYVALGRGLVLSIRKLDELGADTSVQGGKVIGRIKPFTFTGVVGLSNPVRIDEATGIALRDPDPQHLAATGQPTTLSWARDLIVGGRAEAKIASSTIGVQAADFHRRADLGFTGDPTVEAHDITNVGASFAVPKLSADFPLSSYLEIAVQNRKLFDDAPAQAENKGYAAYASFSLTEGIVTTTLEGKHYRGYYPVRVNANTAGAFFPFTAVQYMAPPTLELVTQDSFFDNSCVTGSRARVDVRPSKSLLAFASGAYFANWGERPPGTTQCNIGPAFGLTQGATATPVRNDVYDGYVGFEVRAQREASYVLLTMGARRDIESDTGDSYYREGWIQADIVKVLHGLWSMELNTWQRNRFEGGAEPGAEAWHEGETYLAVKYASRMAYILGWEYTTRKSVVKPGAFLTGDVLGSTMQQFFNVGAQFRFSDNISLRLFVGQQRGALKCVSGVCRQFPNFEGAKSELVISY
jgi:hypothetical protein